MSACISMREFTYWGIGVIIAGVVCWNVGAYFDKRQRR